MSCRLEALNASGADNDNWDPLRLGKIDVGNVGLVKIFPSFSVESHPLSCKLDLSFKFIVLMKHLSYRINQNVT